MTSESVSETLVIFAFENSHMEVIFDNTVVDEARCPSLLAWGWALAPVTAPWVAQRVWQMPTWALRNSSGGPLRVL